MDNNMQRAGIPAKQRVYDYVVQAVTDCELKPGAPLVEHELGERLGLSRTPVREAFKELVRDGFVVHVPGKGTFVRTITVQDVEEVFALREALELLALREAIKRVTPADVDALAALLAGLSPQAPPEQFFAFDRKLHGLLIRLAGNRRLRDFYSVLNIQVEGIRRIASLKPERLHDSIGEHQAILAALKERDLERCTRALSHHISTVKHHTAEVCRAEHFDRLP